MKNTILLLLLVVSVNIIKAQEKYKVFYINEKIPNKYTFDKFTFVHNIFVDAFCKTDLYKKVSFEDMAQMIEAVYQNISVENDVKFEILLTEKPDAKLIFSIVPKTHEGPILTLDTNIDEETKKCVVDYAHSYNERYFIKNNFVVNRKQLFDKEDEFQFKEKNKFYKLIELYLYDEIAEDNTRIEELIHKMLSDEKATDVEKINALIYKQEYFFSINKPDLAKKANTEINEFYSKDKEGNISSNYLLIQKMINLEYEIMNLLWH